MARAKKPTKKEIELLIALVHAVSDGEGMLYVNAKETTKLVELGLVETNPAIVDEAGNIATRPTQEGILRIQGEAPSEQETAPAVPPSAFDTPAIEVIDEAHEVAKTAPAASGTAFELENSVALPSVRRGGRGATMYPFDIMEVGHSFHVPATEDKPNPAKSLASTVSSATSRYKDEDGTITRKFVVRSVGSEDHKGPGARVFRTS